MQPVQKKTRNKKIIRLLTGLGSLLLIAGVAIVIIINNSKKPVTPHVHQAAERYMMIEQKEEDLLRFEVTNSKGEQFALVNTGAGFQVERQPDYPLNEVDVSLMVKDLTILEATDLAGDAPLDTAVLQELGLGPDAPRVTASYRDGQDITLLFGADARTEIPADFIMMADDSKVYTISPETKQHFDRSLNTLHTVPAINFNSQLVQRIRVEGENAFVLEQQEGWWEVKEPVLAAADHQAVGKLLKDIGSMRFALYADEGSSSKLEEYGLLSPRRRIVFELSDSVITGYDKDDRVVDSLPVPAQQIQLDLGADYGNIGLYLLYDGKVYLGSNASMGFLKQLSLASVKSSSPLGIPVNRLRSILAEEGGKQALFTIGFMEAVLPNNQLARDEMGNLLYDILVDVGTAEIKPDSFMQEYLKLMALAGHGALPEGFTADDDQMLRRYQFELLDGTTRELAFYPFDALHAAMRVNGVFVSYVAITTMASLDFLSLMK